MATLSRKRSLAYSALVTLFFFTGLELAFRAVIPSYSYPYFLEEPGAGPGSKSLTFQINESRPTFQVPKPAGTFRIFCFGESSVQGYRGQGFPAWLKAVIEATRPAQKIEIINLGMSGTNSTAIRDWYFPALNMDPDLILLSIGNNEMTRGTLDDPTFHPVLYRLKRFLEHHCRIYQTLQIYQVLFTTDSFLKLMMSWANPTEVGNPLYPEEHRQTVATIYENNLRDMIQAARAKSIPVALISPAANLRGWFPLRSVHYHPLTPTALAIFRQNLEQGRKFLEAGKGEESKTALAAALAQDSTFAEAQFYYARALESLGDLPAARLHYQLAREWDDLPLRAPYRFLELNRQLAASTETLFINLDQDLGQTLPSGVAGFDLFGDSVHYTSRGEYEVARILFQELADHRLIPPGPAPLPPFAALSSTLAIPPNQVAQKHIEAACSLGLLQKHPDVLREAVRQLDQAQEESPGDSLPAILQVSLLSRIPDWEGAGKALSRVYRQSPYAAAVTSQRLLPATTEIYQNQAVLRVTADGDWPQTIYRTMIFLRSSRPPRITPLEFGKISLEQMTAAFLWNEAQQSFVDATPLLQTLQALQRRSSSSLHPPAEINLLAGEKSRIQLHAMAADWDQNHLRANSSDSYLVLAPFPADPLLLPILRLQAKFSAAIPVDNWTTLYWASTKNPMFTEDRKLIFHWPIDNQTRKLEIPLGRILALLRDRPLTALRIDFTTQPAEIELKQLRLTPDQN